MIRAVVFDLDGTLIDSPLCFVTIRKKLEIPPGRPIVEFIEAISSQEERQEKERYLIDLELEYAKESTLKPGVEALLVDLQHSGIRTGVLTRNSREIVDLVLKTHSLRFDRVLAREDARPKPDPEGLFILQREWQVAAEEMVFVGDYIYDLEAGRAAGVKTVLFWDQEGEPSFDARADARISSFDQFPKFS